MKPFHPLTVGVMCVAAGIAMLASSATAQVTGLPNQWTQQRWSRLPRTSLEDLATRSLLFTPPTLTSAVGSSYGSLGDRYIARTRGFISPSTSGIYTFWVSGDDQTQFSLSSDSCKWNSKVLAGSRTWTPLNDFDQSSSQRSVSRFLAAGQRYFVELLHEERSLGDHASVSWTSQEIGTAPEVNWAATSSGGTATQTTNFPGNFPATNAIDGNAATFAHTNNVAASALTVDFRQDRLISRVELLNRQNGWQNRLSNFRVTVEDSAGGILAEKNFYETSGSVGASETWTLPATVAARRVKVQLLGLNRDNNHFLCLAEVRAYGPATRQRNWSLEAAVIATQSTTFSSSLNAARAIDGNSATFSHTADSPGSNLIVNLGADRLIDTVEIINRQDEDYYDRLSNFRISILNDTDAVLASQDFFPTDGYARAALRWELPTATTGRKIKVDLLGLNRAGNSFLQIAELNAWGRENAAVNQRATRSLIPAQVISGYDPTLTDDQDDDAMPDALELSYGLNPNNPADALGDFDQDSINNVTEIWANSNPSVKNDVPGLLLDEIWHNVPGDNLTLGAYKTAFTYDPDFTAHLTTSQAFAKGDQYIRRVRGYLTAPVTGSYQFWGAGDSDVDMFLSTTASKFERQPILDSKVLTSIYNYDFDLSQKSRLISLVAGKKYYFEMWHKEGIGGSYFSVAWKAPGGVRQLIPTQYLSSYPGEANDQDDDYLKDDYELANGLSITDDGKSPGSNDGIYGDLDGDGLTNSEEQKFNTNSNLTDSDGNGVNDYDEANFFESATLANSIGAFTPVLTLNGDAYTANFGEWERVNSTARQNCRRGSVSYPLTVPKSGVYAAKITITSTLDGAKSEQYEFDVRMNGKRVAYKTVNILPNGTGTLALLTPWLKAGEGYQLEVFVNNAYNFRRVSIDQLQILAAGGVDSNGNDTPDWVEIRQHQSNGFDQTVILSKTSPATVEGNAQHLAFLTTNGTIVTQAPNDRFFTDIPLAPSATTTLNFAFENGAVTQTATVQWLPTNLLQETSITLRQGDSLLLTACQNAQNANQENYSITANGQTYEGTADQPSQVTFQSPGSNVIQLIHNGSSIEPTTRSINVTVLPLVQIPAPLCIVGYPRSWSHPNLPVGSTLQFDQHVKRWKEAAPDTYTLLSNTPENRTILVRQGTNGPILGSTELMSASVSSGSKTGVLITSNFPDYQILEMPIVVSGNLDTAEIRCDIIIGGVRYLDGTTTKSLSSANFDSFGTNVIFFKKPPAAHSNCHRFSIWHNGTRVAFYD
jgi:F5/8 type C domain/PA14 domain